MGTLDEVDDQHKVGDGRELRASECLVTCSMFPNLLIEFLEMVF